MNWSSDPPSKWVAAYRITVLVLLIIQGVLLARNQMIILGTVQKVCSAVDGCPPPGPAEPSR